MKFVEEIVDKLVARGIIPDDPESRKIASETISSIAKQRIRRTIRQVIEVYLQEPKHDKQAFN